MVRTSREKLNEETVAFYDTADQTDHRTLQPKAALYTFFPGTLGMFSRGGHILGQKNVPMNLRRLKVYQEPFPIKMV